MGRREVGAVAACGLCSEHFVLTLCTVDLSHFSGRDARVALTAKCAPPPTPSFPPPLFTHGPSAQQIRGDTDAVCRYGLLHVSLPLLYWYLGFSFLSWCGPADATITTTRAGQREAIRGMAAQRGGGGTLPLPLRHLHRGPAAALHRPRFAPPTPSSTAQVALVELTKTSHAGEEGHKPKWTLAHGAGT
jgi:hypothetical protein